MTYSSRKQHLLFLATLVALLHGVVANKNKDKDDQGNGGATSPPTQSPYEPPDGCNLCATGLPGLRWPNAKVDGHGKTCAEHVVDVFASFEDDSSECHWEVIKHRHRCCMGDVEPPDPVQFPTIPPQAKNGPNVCDICFNGKFPGDTSMVIAMLDIGMGAAPCDYFYYIGQDGLIPPHLCHPLQHFAYSPCGCAYGIDVGGPADDPETDAPTAASTSTLAPSPSSTDMPSLEATTVPPGRRGLHAVENRGGRKPLQSIRTRRQGLKGSKQQ